MKKTLSIGFVLNKQNYYSFSALLASLESDKRLNSKVKVIFINNDSEVKCDVYCYSFMSFNVKEIFENMLIRKRQGGIIIAGGPHSSACPGQVAKYADYVVVGSAEKTFCEIIYLLVKGENPEKRIFKEEFINIDEFPCYAESGRLFSPIEIMRGCYFKCKFCAVSCLNKKVSFRSLKNIEKAARLSAKFGRKRSWFLAPDSFSYMKVRNSDDVGDLIRELLYTVKKAGIEEMFFGTFPSETRPDSVNKKILKAIKKFCNNKIILIGAQSGADSVLKRIGRGHTVEDIYNSADQVYVSGFVPHFGYILGFPEESEEEMHETLNLIEKLHELYSARAHIHYFLPLPGSEFENKTPVSLPESVRNRLISLTGKGYVDGYWQRHEKLVKEGKIG